MQRSDAAAADTLTSRDIKDSPSDGQVHWLIRISAIMLFQLAESQFLGRDNLNAAK